MSHATAALASHNGLGAPRASCARPQCHQKMRGGGAPLRKIQPRHQQQHLHQQQQQQQRRRRRRRTQTAAAAAGAGAVERNTHTVPSGLKLEVLSQKAASTADEKKNSSPPPIVFVHGSYHAAWCWREHFFQYFTDRGHDVYAVSMRRGRQFSIVATA